MKKSNNIFSNTKLRKFNTFLGFDGVDNQDVEKITNKTKMLVKIHKSFNGIVVAICDNDLIDKKFEQGKLQLDLTTDFYKGNEITEKEVKEILTKAYIVNLVGKKAVDFGLKNKIIEKENIKTIAKIPFCQCVIVRE